VVDAGRRKRKRPGGSIPEPYIKVRREKERLV
jgi:hypothetical protein